MQFKDAVKARVEAEITRMASGKYPETRRNAIGRLAAALATCIAEDATTGRIQWWMRLEEYAYVHYLDLCESDQSCAHVEGLKPTAPAWLDSLADAGSTALAGEHFPPDNTSPVQS